MLERENRKELAEKCFAFLPTRIELDSMGWGSVDIFNHQMSSLDLNPEKFSWSAVN